MGKMTTRTQATIMVLFSTLIVSAGQILLKLGSRDLSFSLDLLTNYALITAFILYGLGSVILIIALKYGELSVLYPIYATSYVWVSLLSPMFFPSDSMNAVKWIGLFTILTGVILISRGGGK